MAKPEKFYWFDNDDYLVCGPFDTERAAREAAEEDNSHTRTYTIVKAVSESTPPSLKRVWKAA